MSHPRIWVNVLGGRGFIGRALMKKIGESEDMVAVTDHGFLSKVDVVINLIRPYSFMDVMKRCTPLINNPAPVIHVSSMSVVRSPFTKYAMMKRLEEILLPGACILRLPTVYGRKDDNKCVLDIWEERSEAGLPILVFRPERRLEYVFIDEVVSILIGLIKMEERPHLMESHSRSGPIRLLDLERLYSNDILVVKRMK